MLFSVLWTAFTKEKHETRQSVDRGRSRNRSSGVADRAQSRGPYQCRRRSSYRHGCRHGILPPSTGCGINGRPLIRRERSGCLPCHKGFLSRHARALLSSYQDDEAVLAAVFEGASGYLLKQVNAEGLLRAIHAVAQGQSILDPAITQPLLARMRLQKEETSEPQRTTLSTQQQRVLALVAEGKTNKEIGLSLELSDKTVKNYVRFIFRS